MKIIHQVMPLTLSVIGLTLSVSSPAIRQTVSPATSRLVLRLPYRGSSDKPLSSPYHIGMFTTETNFYDANFMGTDWEGNIYIMDPIAPDLHVLKQFDRRGRFRESWNPIRARSGEGVVVTQDGYIWTGLGGIHQGDGLPIVVYQRGRKDPILDWRKELPKELDNSIRQALEEKGLEWKKGWMVWHLEGGTGQMGMRFTGKAVGHEGQMARILWILVRSDGGQVLDAKVAKEWYGAETPYLSPDGRFWAFESDFDVERFTWNKVWLWEKGKERGEPLMDRTATKEPWADIVTLGKARLPTIKIDAKEHIYLIFRRDTLTTQEKRTVVGGKIVDSYPPGTTVIEQGVVVLSNQRKVISYVPWYQGGLAIHPLPDGSGFYRIIYLEREAQVFFHPLPQ